MYQKGSRMQVSGFAVGGNIRDLIWQTNRFKIGGGGSEMEPGIGGRFMLWE